MEVKTNAPDPYGSEPYEPHPFQEIYELAKGRNDISVKIPYPDTEYRAQVVAPINFGWVVKDGTLTQKYSLHTGSAFVRVWEVAARCGISIKSLHAAQAVVNDRIRAMASGEETQQFVAEWNHRAKMMCMAAALAEKAMEGAAPGQGADQGQTLDAHSATFAAWVDRDPRARRLFVSARIAFELSFARGDVAITLLGEATGLSESAYAKSGVRELPAALLETARARLRTA